MQMVKTGQNDWPFPNTWTQCQNLWYGKHHRLGPRGQSLNTSENRDGMIACKNISEYLDTLAGVILCQQWLSSSNITSSRWLTSSDGRFVQRLHVHCIGQFLFTSSWQIWQNRNGANLMITSSFEVFGVGKFQQRSLLNKWNTVFIHPMSILCINHWALWCTVT